MKLSHLDLFHDNSYPTEFEYYPYLFNDEGVCVDNEEKTYNPPNVPHEFVPGLEWATPIETCQ